MSNSSSSSTARSHSAIKRVSILRLPLFAEELTAGLNTYHSENAVSICSNFDEDCDHRELQYCSTASNGCDDIPRKSKNNRRVSFGEVECRIYDRTAGVHPAVHSGPALDFDWSYATAKSIALEEYEASNPKTRTRSELVVPKSQRINILRRQYKVPRALIANSVRSISQTRKQRRQTVNNLGFAEFEEKIERAGRFLRRMMLVRKSYKREVKGLWKKAPDELAQSTATLMSSSKTIQSILVKTDDILFIENQTNCSVKKKKKNVSIRQEISSIIIETNKCSLSLDNQDNSSFSNPINPQEANVIPSISPTRCFESIVMNEDEECMFKNLEGQ